MMLNIELDGVVKYICLMITDGEFRLIINNLALLYSHQM